MAKTISATATFLILSSFLLTTPVYSQNCPPVSCRPNNGPLIRFPFRLSNRQPARCGYPGFDLSCNNDNETILNLPGSGKFVVAFLDYMRQAFYINDPDSCLPSRLFNFTVSDSPFLAGRLRDYTFLNCSSSNYMDYPSTQFTPLYCISERNYTVLAMDRNRPGNQVPDTCMRIGDVSVPTRWALYWSGMDMPEGLELLWRIPGCRGCENRGGICGYRGGSGLDIGCSASSISRRGLPRGARYGLIIGIGVPGLVCIIGLICYSCGMLKGFTGRDPLSSNLPITSFSTQQLAIRNPSGLDGPTIESYPKTVLGASRRLPKPSDATCPICLSDYLSEETLRTIPECNHYFHAECIDEWLKLNGTCPLCRKSPQTPSITSSHSSLSVSSSVSTTPSDS